MDYSKSNWVNSLHNGYNKVRNRYPDPTQMGRDELNYKLQERESNTEYKKLLWEHWDHSTAFPAKTQEERQEHYKRMRRKIHMFWNKNMHSTELDD